MIVCLAVSEDGTLSERAGVNEVDRKRLMGLCLKDDITNGFMDTEEWMN